jgi:Cu(I)/Ag(I) efflux system membrane fusion protein
MNVQKTNIDSEPIPTDEVATAPALRSRMAGFWFGVRMLEVRLRFIAVLVGLGLVIGYWDTLQNYWDRWTRPAVAVSSTAASDTEFYCPMDPSVIRDGPEPNGAAPKCPICGMPLSLRKKGAPMTLPPGVVGRVSLTPDRVQMAGIRTAEIGIRPMNRVIRAVGTVAYNQSKQSQIVTRVGGYLEKLMVDRTFMKVNQGDPLAEIYSPELYAAIQELKIAKTITGSSLAKIAREKVQLLGIDDKEIDGMLEATSEKYRIVIRSPVDGSVIQKMVQQGASVEPGQLLFEIADLSSVWIEADIYERDIAMLHKGQQVTTTVDAYPNRPFSGTVALIYPEMQIATRTNRVRFEVDNTDLLLKPGMYATVNFEESIQQSEPFHSILVSSLKPPVDPAAAILQQSICPVTGAKLGSMGDPIPVIANGQTVYLCCAGCKGAIEKRPDYYLSRIRTVTDSGVLAVPETAVIDTGDQKIVYVEREKGVFEGLEVKLGPKVDGYYSVVSGLLPGDKVAAAGAFLIDAETRLNPAASAAYFGAGGGPSGGSAGTTSTTTIAVPGPDSSTDGLPQMILPPASNNSKQSAPDASPSRFTAEELANIGKLSLKEQELAQLQVLCPITDMALGSMGVPLSIIVANEKVMICCAGCEQMAKRDAAGTLEKVNRWKSENQKAKK